MAATLQKQQELLRQASEPGVQWQVQVGCLSVLLVLAMAVAFWAIGARQWGGLFAAAVLVLMGLGIRHSGQTAAPHIARARLALTQFEAVEGRVRVVATSDDGSTTYRAGVCDRQGRDWSFAFSPFDWRPDTGDVPAQLRYTGDTPWPALVLTEAGLICPLDTPKPQALALPVADAPPSRASVRAGWIAAAAFLTVGGLVAGGAWAVYFRDAAMVEQGGVAQAVVTRVGHVRAKPGQSHGLVYQFVLPDGRVMAGAVTEEAERWRSFQVGDTFTVHYDLGNPQRQVPATEGKPSLGMAVFVSVIGLAFLAAGALLAVGAWRAGQRL